MERPFHDITTGEITTSLQHDDVICTLFNCPFNFYPRRYQTFVNLQQFSNSHNIQSLERFNKMSVNVQTNSQFYSNQFAT